ncbi:hypothetical protein E2562_018121 [Oryza meyeriana var. granulata]|uniref:Uncharacterized protein n=1 Tax=Oryza meyeriana var. granulata TaxID=110450 RepID=A0A6G1C725_9ORYZ|nr:hypothetical protein E2562_018121 [Oryza meyeriana var. granulata]
MDATHFSAPRSHLLLAPSSAPLHLRRRKVPAGDRGGGGSPARVKTWSKNTGMGRRNGERLRVNSVFGDGGGGDGFRTVRRLVKLNSAIQNRSVRELIELVGDECLYFFAKMSSIDVSQIGKNAFLLLHSIMLRHHVSFVLKPTENEGFDLGVKWSLEWKGKKLPWDLDCNITTNHVYRGMLLINEVNKVYWASKITTSQAWSTVYSYHNIL